MVKEKLKFLSFWAVNDSLSPDKMKLQLLQLKELGLDGVVYKNRKYPGNPEYLSMEYMNILSDIILYAKSLKLQFWLYDVEKYQKGLKAEAFDYVEGFFSDEADSFYRPVAEWYGRYKKKYTVWFKEEANPHFQLAFNEFDCQILKNVPVPGVNTLGRYPGNAYYPRIASSVAKQFHSGESLCKVMGGSGWGLNPEDFINYMKWLIQCGIKTFVLHLQQFKLTGEAIRDWPPSLPLHMTWKNGFPGIIQEIRQWEKDFRKEEEKKPLFLLVAPARGVMGGLRPKAFTAVNVSYGNGITDSSGEENFNEFIDFVEQCSNLKIRFDITEEKIVEEYTNITSDGVQIGHKTYGKVILSNGCLWKNQEIIKAIKENGFLMARESLKQKDYRKEEIHKFKKHSLTQTPWKYKSSGENQLLLPFNENQKPVYECLLRIQDEKELKDIYLYSSDLADDVIFNGYKLEKQTDKDGFIYPVPDELVRTPLWNIKIDVSGSEEKEPFIYIKGNFLVFSEDSYGNKGKRELVTKGPFYLSGKIEKVNCNNLIESGFPFMGTEIIMTKEFSNTEVLSPNSLKLSGVFADMLKVRVDGQSACIHGSDWSIPFAVKPGAHEMEITCYPSTYNTYGPHHYMGGDYKLISPGQYKGTRNFADPARFPKKTRTDNWNFVKFGIEKELYAYIVSQDKKS